MDCEKQVGNTDSNNHAVDGLATAVFTQQVDKFQPLPGVLNLLALLSGVAPAVSSRTASLVNHQSQLRVPPMPRSAVLPKRSASGNCSPSWPARWFYRNPARQ